MDFISNTEEQQQEMLDTIGIAQIEDLFTDIAEEIRVPRPQEDDGLSEWEGMQLMRAIGRKNEAYNYSSYLGAGAYEHHVPAIVNSITGKSEFLTAYTPYQAEASQGMLQAIFEFQSAVCGLTGLDVANASVYDGASACAEALLMALRSAKGREKVVVAESLHPHYQAVIEEYLPTTEILTLPSREGKTTPEDVKAALDDNTAALLLPYPNFFGGIDAVADCFAAAQEAGVITIACANPLVWALYQSAEEIGADIAVGDLQPLGLPLSFGGPYVGYMACKKKFMRQMPGRLVGETTDAEGRRGFTLTLQAREQHIRREKATSNICSNQNLAAMACLVTMLWYGPKGLHKLALTNYQRAAYLKEKLCALPGVEPLRDLPHLNEFSLRFPIPVEKVVEHLEKKGILAGVPLGTFYPKYNDCLLIAVTETKTQEQLDHYVASVQEVL